MGIHFAYGLWSTENPAFPVEAEWCFDVMSNFLSVFRVKYHAVKFGREKHSLQLRLMAAVGIGTVTTSKHHPTIAYSFIFEREVACGWVILVVMWMLGCFFPFTYSLVFIKLSGKIVVSCKVTHSIAVDLLMSTDSCADYEHQIDQDWRPGSRSTTSIDKYVGKGIEFMLCSLFKSQSHLVIYVVLKIVIATDSFLHLVSKVDCFAKDSPHLFQKLSKTGLAFRGFLVPVDEQHQHLRFTIEW